MFWSGISTIWCLLTVKALNIIVTNSTKNKNALYVKKKLEPTLYEKLSYPSFRERQRLFGWCFKHRHYGTVHTHGAQIEGARTWSFYNGNILVKLEASVNHLTEFSKEMCVAEFGI